MISITLFISIADENTDKAYAEINLLHTKKELHNNGILTRGNISKIETVSENEEDNDRYYYYVSYCDHKGNRHESKLLRHDRNCAYKQGDEIMIRYKADDPKFVVEDKR